MEKELKGLENAGCFEVEVYSRFPRGAPDSLEVDFHNKDRLLRECGML